MSKKKLKLQPREFFVLESETGWDIKKYYHSFHKTKEEAEALKRYLQLKDPYDKREVVHVREVIKK